MVIVVNTASLVDSSCTDVLSTNEAVFTTITIPVVLMFCALMEQYILVLTLLVSTASLVDRKSVQQEW
jgi:hypothetical protein